MEVYKMKRSLPKNSSTPRMRTHVASVPAPPITLEGNALAPSAIEMLGVDHPLVRAMVGRLTYASAGRLVVICSDQSEVGRDDVCSRLRPRPPTRELSPTCFAIPYGLAKSFLDARPEHRDAAHALAVGQGVHVLLVTGIGRRPTEGPLIRVVRVMPLEVADDGPEPPRAA